MGKRIKILVYLGALQLGINTSSAVDPNHIATIEDAIRNMAGTTYDTRKLTNLVVPPTTNVVGSLLPSITATVSGPAVLSPTVLNELSKGENVLSAAALKAFEQSKNLRIPSNTDQPLTPPVPLIDATKWLNLIKDTSSRGYDYYDNALSYLGDKILAAPRWISQRIGGIGNEQQSLYDYIGTSRPVTGLKTAMEPLLNYEIPEYRVPRSDSVPEYVVERYKPMQKYVVPFVNKSATLAAGAAGAETLSYFLYNWIINKWYGADIIKLKRISNDLLAHNPRATFETVSAAADDQKIELPNIYKAKAFFMALADRIGNVDDANTGLINEYILNAMETYNGLTLIRYTKYINPHRPLTFLSDIYQMWQGSTPIHRLEKAYYSTATGSEKKALAIGAINEIVSSLLNSIIATAGNWISSNFY